MFGLIPFDRRHRGMQSNDAHPFDMDSILENFFNDSVFPSFFANSGQMKVDVRSTEDAYILDADLPGINKDQVKLDIDDDRLTIRVVQDETQEEKNDNYIRRERRQSSLTRSFGLSDVDQEKITAAMENGVLHITLPKLADQKPRGRNIDIT